MTAEGLAARDEKAGRPAVEKRIRVLSKISNENSGGRVVTRQHSEAPAVNTPLKQRRKWPKITAAVVLLAAVGIIVAGFGFVHLINGSSLSVPRVVLKSSFGYKKLL